MMVTSFFPLAVLILAVLGTILFGLATPTEAAAIGALGGMALAVAYRAMTFERLRESVYLTVRTTAMVCWLFVGSYTFSSVFSYLGGEQIISEFVTGLNLSPLMFLLLAQLIIFLLGWPLEWSEIIIIFVPIFLPLLPHFGIDPLFFGILVALNLQTSFLTPPMAMSAYYLKGSRRPRSSWCRSSADDAVPADGVHLDGHRLHLPADRLPPAGRDLWPLVRRRRRPLAGLGAVALRDRLASGALHAGRTRRGGDRPHRRDGARDRRLGLARPGARARAGASARRVSRAPGGRSGRCTACRSG